MSLEQKIITKLQPHAKRILDGNGEDFDYLPAVLLQIIESQKFQAEKLESFMKNLGSVKGAIDVVALENKERMSALELIVQQKIDRLELLLEESQRSQRNSKRLLVAVLVASLAVGGLVVLLLQRH